MKSRVLFLLAILVGSASVSAQNLVPNGSFEEGVECPSFIGNLDAQCLHWFSSIAYPPPTSVLNPTPEWYHTCSEFDVFVPPNVVFGYQEPFDGDGYVGLAIFNNQLGVEYSYREPIGIELIEPLVEGNTYLVEFSIVRLYSQPTTLAANNFGFKFTNVPVYNYDSLLIDNTAAFKIDTIVSDTTNWLTVSTEIIADSNFSYVHFGNFYDNANTDFIANTEIGIFAYLALDGVSITEVLTTNTTIQTSDSNVSIYPNPAANHFSIESKEGITNCKIFAISGQLIKTFKVNVRSTIEIQLEDVPSGTYILHISTPKSHYHEKLIKL